MFPLLRQEMKSRQITQCEIADLLDIDIKSVCRKINGHHDFKLSEMELIRDNYFKELTLDQLFRRV